MEGMIPAPFAAALSANRSRFNSLFAQASYTMRGLDGAKFSTHLREAVSPVVAAVAGTAPHRVPAVVDVLYEVSLELVGKGLLGPESRYPVLNRLWPELLTALAVPVADSPRLVIGSLTNGLYNLVITSGARPDQWCKLLIRLNQLDADVKTLLQAGQVAGWRCGLAHYRSSAIEVARQLPDHITLAALDLSATASGAVLLDHLEANPWFDPANPSTDRELRVALIAGAFRGFGGVFIRPPRIVYHAGHFHAFDGETCWLVAVDCWGATFNRAGATLPPSEETGPYRITKSGHVAGPKQRRTFENLRFSTSAASSPTTLAVSLPCSHAIYFVAGDAS